MNFDRRFAGSAIEMATKFYCDQQFQKKTLTQSN